MDRLTKLRLRSSTGLNASSTSLGNGYETANDESVTSGSVYFSMTEEAEETAQPETEKDVSKEEPTLSGVAIMKADSTIDQTLENDFSVEEVSTIRKPMIAQASPATVKIASKMSEKYLGVSSTPARHLKSTGKVQPKTPGSGGRNLSGFAKLDETDDKKSSSILVKMREPKILECSAVEEAEESKMLDSSVQSVVDNAGAVSSNKSFGANVLANFFASLDVNKATPVPEIIVQVPDESTEKTPGKKRDSNSLQNFFESLKKNPDEQAKENRPKTDQRKNVRKSLLPKAPQDRPKTRPSILASANENRVASPIGKPQRKSSHVKLIPDRLKEMRKANQSDLVNFKRASIVPPPKTIVAAVGPVQESKKAASDKEEVVGDSLKVKVKRTSYIPAPRIVTKAPDLPSIAMKRKSVVPTAVASRQSVLPAKTFRRSVLPGASLAQPRLTVKVPAKTTLSSSDTTRRSSLGKRSSTQAIIDRTEPQAKMRKSLAPTKEVSEEVSPKTTIPPPSQIRPPTAPASSVVAASNVPFKRPENFPCDECQRSFRLKSSLDSHKKFAHQNGTKSPVVDNNTKSSETSLDTKCRFCAKTFANTKILSNHVISHCLKIPPLEKRKILAIDEKQRAASAKLTPETARSNGSRFTRPSTGIPARPKLLSVGSNRTNTSSQSVDGSASDTSTSSSIGNTSANGNNSTTNKRLAKGVVRKPNLAHTGISRTPKKEMKCHLCSRKFLNTVEYALHVQAHSKAVEPLERDAKELEQSDISDKLLHMGAAAEIVQKLATVMNRANK